MSAAGHAIALLAVLGPLVAAGACSDGERTAGAGLREYDPRDRPGIRSASPCESGASRPCTVTLGSQDGVRNCFKGVERCEDGVWGECAEGEYFQIPVLDETMDGGPRFRTKSLSRIAKCRSNPCDPSCRVFEERPDGGWLPEFDGAAAASHSWRSGRGRDYGPEAFAAGRREPCTRARDCQFNTYCQSPSIGGCSHSQCQQGASLVAGCNPCVQDICEADPSCCYSPPGCAHDPCVEGSALDVGCDPCVSAVCAELPECCAAEWTAECVEVIEASCGNLPVPQSCGCSQSEVSRSNKCYLHVTTNKSWQNASSDCRARGPGWDLVRIDDEEENAFIDDLVETSVWIGASDADVEGDWRWADGTPFWSGAGDGTAVDGLYSHWDAQEPWADTASNCAVFSRYNDDWRASSCGYERDSVCEGPSSLSPSAELDAWTATCTGLVDDVCGAKCDSATPPAADGLCEPWYPGLVDPTCPSFDVAVGLTCIEEGVSVIPVCNHGSMPAPAGLRLVHLPPGQIGSESPDLDDGESCVTDAPIEPGECIEVIDCPELVDGREIIVNPRDGSEASEECRFDDNWSVFQSGGCGAPICSGSSSSASVVPVNMLIVVDRSRSMNRPVGTTTRWDATVTALKAFFYDPASAGLGVALRFFPEDVPVAGCNQFDCNALSCAEPRVTLGALVEEFAPADAQEEALFSALDSTTPGGSGTPIYPALDGAMRWAVMHQQENPKSEYVVVLVTDGEPTDCNTDIDAIAALSSNAFGSHGIRTYTLGVDEPDTVNAVTTIAAAGGGRAFLVSADGSSSVTDQVLDSFRAIAGENISCTFSLENTGGFDPDLAAAVFSFPATPPASTAGPHCNFQLGEVLHGDSCYYLDSFGADSWTDAREACRARGAGWDLVSITSPSENLFVDNLAADAAVWMGLNDRTAEGVFTWSNGQCVSPEAFSSFGPGEPSNGDCPDCAPENCTIVAQGGRWADEECLSSVPLEFVCEGPTVRSPGACRPGEYEGPDSSCYVLGSVARSYDQARAACAARGAQWDLARIDTAEENDFVTARLGCTDAWVQSGGTFENYVPAAPGSGCPRVRQTGEWTDEDCSRALSFFCEGPLVNPGEILEESLEGVADVNSCSGDDQWYFDDATNPTAIELCPDTCERVRGRSTGRLSIEIGCISDPAAVETTRREIYRANCSEFADGGFLPDAGDAGVYGKLPQWGFLSYDATLPGDSSIRFSARTADERGALEAESFVPIVVATESNASCGLGGTVPGCPVDLFAELGDTMNRRRILELNIVLVPGTRGEVPRLNDWDVTFSCVDGL